jgi:hypothetical protein
VDGEDPTEDEVREAEQHLEDVPISQADETSEDTERRQGDAADLEGAFYMNVCGHPQSKLADRLAVGLVADQDVARGVS